MTSQSKSTTNHGDTGADGADGGSNASDATRHRPIGWLFWRRCCWSWWCWALWSGIGRPAPLGVRKPGLPDFFGPVRPANRGSAIQVRSAERRTRAPHRDPCDTRNDASRARRHGRFWYAGCRRGTTPPGSSEWVIKQRTSLPTVFAPRCAARSRLICSRCHWSVRAERRLPTKKGSSIQQEGMGGWMHPPGGRAVGHL